MEDVNSTDEHPVLLRRGRNPLPFLRGHAYRFSENLAYTLILGATTSGLVLAGANAGGWTHLAGLAAAMSGALALAQAVGAQLAKPRGEREVGGSRSS